MQTQFVQLNYDWNAESDSPHERVDEFDDHIDLSFEANSKDYTGYSKGQRVLLRFYGCSRWRIGNITDVSWQGGKCRFSEIAPGWGQFYEVIGDPLMHECPHDWSIISSRHTHRHFIFYLRDCEFECSADNYEFIHQN